MTTTAMTNNDKDTHNRLIENNIDMGEKILDFDVKKNTAPAAAIKIIGVGGGGGNAVKNMIRQGLSGVTFLLCNTDRQAMEDCDEAEKIVLGPEITKGLGAGNRPEVARAAAEASRTEIQNALNDGHTQMVFITAGMGGGTGTGAAPVIGGIAKKMGLLTVSIVTIPFVFEREKKIIRALKGVEEMRKNTDSLLIINNERLRYVYKDLSWENARKEADNAVTKAARGISDMITRNLKQNVDLNDVRTALKDGGIAIIGIGYGEGKNRVRDAIRSALESPLLNDNDITNATNVYMVLYESSQAPIGMDELDAVHELMCSINTDPDSKIGHGSDETLGERVQATILASGFDKAVKYGLDRDLDPFYAEEQQEQKRKEAELLVKYYKSKDLAQPTSIASFTPVLLHDDELDDDEIIAALEETPAYSRDITKIENIRKKNGHRRLSNKMLQNVIKASSEDELHESLPSLEEPQQTSNEKPYKPNIIVF